MKKKMKKLNRICSVNWNHSNLTNNDGHATQAGQQTITKDAVRQIRLESQWS